MVRSKLEYCTSIWDLHHKKNKDRPESVQNKDAPFVTGDHDRRSSMSAMIDELEWPILKQHGEILPGQPFSSRLTQIKSTSRYRCTNSRVTGKSTFLPLLESTCMSAPFSQLLPEHGTGFHKESPVPKSALHLESNYQN